MACATKISYRKATKDDIGRLVRASEFEGSECYRYGQLVAVDALYAVRVGNDDTEECFEHAEVEDVQVSFGQPVSDPIRALMNTTDVDLNLEPLIFVSRLPGFKCEEDGKQYKSSVTASRYKRNANFDIDHSIYVSISGGGETPEDSAEKLVEVLNSLGFIQ